MGIRITYNKVTGSGYIYFKDIQPGESKRQVVLPSGLIFDLDQDGRVIGAEFLNRVFIEGLDEDCATHDLIAKGVSIVAE
jgi:hypothetical protein